jgi:cation diffusion facilitator family transporter
MADSGHDTAPLTSRRSVMIGLGVAVAQTVALAVAAAVTGSAALRTQTATNVADVAVGAFLLIGVVSSDRPADDDHPLGYGRERFFWSFVAATGIFVGGVGAAFVETLQAALHTERTGSYLVGYVVLAVVFMLDIVALAGSIRPVSRRARNRGISVTACLWHSTDPAITTVVLSSAAGALGGVIAAAGLAGKEITGGTTFDALASALIGLTLLGTSVVMLHTNRELLTGRGVGPGQVEKMRQLVAAEAGIVEVADIFAIVVGPSTVIVDADVIFDDELDVPKSRSSFFAPLQPFVRNGRRSASSISTRWPATDPAESGRDPQPILDTRYAGCRPGHLLDLPVLRPRPHGTFKAHTTILIAHDGDVTLE